MLHVFTCRLGAAGSKIVLIRFPVLNGPSCQKYYTDQFREWGRDKIIAFGGGTLIRLLLNSSRCQLDKLIDSSPFPTLHAFHPLLLL